MTHKLWMPRIAGNQQKKEERHETDSPSGPPQGTITTDISISTSGLLNYERVDFCCFKHPSWWYFVATA